MPTATNPATAYQPPPPTWGVCDFFAEHVAATSLSKDAACARAQAEANLSRFMHYAVNGATGEALKFEPAAVAS